MQILHLPPDLIDGVVFLAILGDGTTHDQLLGSDAGVRQVVVALGSACRALRLAVSIKRIARRCLSSPSIFEDLLMARRRVSLHRFLRMSGGYELAVQIFQQEIQRLRVSLPLPIVAMSCKLSGRLFTQISAYAEAEIVLLAALEIDKQIQGDRAEEVASTHHMLSEMLRGSVSACQVASERRQFALRGMKYSRECFAIRRAAFVRGEDDDRAHKLRLAGIANALHLLGYHCAEFAKGSLAKLFFEQASKALSRAQKIFRDLDDHAMTATTLQDLGLCYYYQHRYREALELYTSACRVIIEKLGCCHPDLAVPAFNIANIMCAADQFRRAIDFYRIAFSINVTALGMGHAWTKTALCSLQEAIEYHNDRMPRVADILFELVGEQDEEPPNEDASAGLASGEGGGVAHHHPFLAAGACDVCLACEDITPGQDQFGSELSLGGSLHAQTVTAVEAGAQAASSQAPNPAPHAHDAAGAVGEKEDEAGTGGDSSHAAQAQPLEGKTTPRDLVLTEAAIEELLLMCLKDVDINVEVDQSSDFYSGSDEGEPDGECPLRSPVRYNRARKELSLIESELESLCQGVI
jgi:tetratricopeptide (TPR) repeat protein